MRLRLAPASASLLLVGLTAACASASGDGPAPHVLAAVTPTEQFAVEVTSVPDEILLAPHGVLSAAQSAALGELAARWRETGESPVAVDGPSGGPGAATAQAAVRALHAYGVPEGAVQVNAAAEGEASTPPAPVRVSFARLAAVGPNCAGQWDEVTRTKENLPYAAFGCAMTANFAAQIADPRDLVRPRGFSPADGDRRATVMEKYRKGEPTASERADDERGVVSRTIQ